MNDFLNIYNTFGCGMDRDSFHVCFDSLSPPNREKLNRVAQRFWFTTKLRYESSFFANPNVSRQKESSIIFTEIPALEIYLLFTCLDTLASKPYDEFDSWLRKQNFPANEILSVEQVISLYQKYKQEFGVTKNIKKLFGGIPEAGKIWLAEHVIIQPEKEPNMFTPINPNDLVTRLQKFYYEYWRNAYTHNSVARVANTIELMDERNNKPEWLLATPSPIKFSSNSNKGWNVYYKNNVDLSIILRMIVYMASLQFLGIESSRKMIDIYLSNLHRSRFLYWSLYEFRENYNQVWHWMNIKIRQDAHDIPTIMDYIENLVPYGVPPLTITALANLLHYLDPNSDFEKLLIVSVTQYIELVQEYNSAINSFNKTNPPKQDLEADDVTQRSSQIYTFIRKIASLPCVFGLYNYEIPQHQIMQLLGDTCPKIG